MRSIGGVLLVVLACGAEPWPDAACEAVCRRLRCEETLTECFQAVALFGCACDGCADCRSEGRQLLEDVGNSTAPGCAQPCFGDARGCDAFVPLGATCVDLETNEWLKISSVTCDCSGCLLCAETDVFAPAVDLCDGGELGGATLEIGTEVALTAALATGAPCTFLALKGDMALGAAAYFKTAVRLVGADGPARPVLSPASGPHRLVAGTNASQPVSPASATHRLVTVVNQAVVFLTSVVLRDGFDAFGGGCVFVGGGAALTLDRVALENCAAGAVGGGLAGWTSASLFVGRSSFAGNVAGAMGGSVYGHSRAAVVLIATTVGHSSAFGGGGVTITRGATLHVSNHSQIYGCIAGINGGGVFLARDAVGIFSSGSVVSTSHGRGGGGGVFGITSSTVVLEGRCAIVNCTATTLGGGLQIYDAAVVAVSDCAFVGCVALTSSGGGVLLRMVGTSGATFTNVDFLNCATPEGLGGGLNLGTATTAALANSRFDGCSAGTAGGAVSVSFQGGVVALTRTSFTRCHSSGDGGALLVNPGCRASIDDSIFSDNAAGNHGGAIAASATSKVAVFGGTRVERNVAAYSGGGLALLWASTVGVANAVIAFNVAIGGGGGAATVGAGATLHLGRAALLIMNIAASDGGAVEVRGKGAQLYVSASCSFVQVTLDWTAVVTLDAALASVFLGYGGAPAGPARDARGAPAYWAPQNGVAARFEACLPPGRGYELWAASALGQSWLEGSWSLTLPPHEGSVLSFVETRETFVQAVNEYGVSGPRALLVCRAFSKCPAPPAPAPANPRQVLGIGYYKTHGALAAAFDLDENEAAFHAAADPDGIDAVRIIGNVAVAGDGGGVAAAEAGRAVVYEALFEANAALTGSGGAVAIGAQSSAELRAVDAIANVAGHCGGAVGVGTLGVVDVYNTTATANVAGARGGFAALDRASAASFHTVVARGNRAADSGGALAFVLCDQAPVVITHSTFQNNSAALGGGALDVEASSLRVNGATLFAENSVAAGSGGSVAVRPTGATLTLASQPATCVALLRVVVDWRRNAQRCKLFGALGGTLTTLEHTCDFLPSTCDAGEQHVILAQCAGCTCKASQLGAGQNYFSVYRVADADGARLPEEAAPLFVGEPNAGAAKEFEYCLEAGEYEVTAYDRGGTAWFGGTLEATVSDFDGLGPFHRGSADWAPSGFEAGPMRFVVGGVPPKALAVRFVDNEALAGGGAAVYWTAEAPVGLEAAKTYSTGNVAAYGPFAATPATQLLVSPNSTLTTVYALPNAAMPAISIDMLDGYGHIVRADLAVAISAQFIDDGQAAVQASGLVAICKDGVATFDAIAIRGLPGDAHRLRFVAVRFALESAPLTVELTACPVGFVERVDGDAGVTCIACKYTEFYADGRCTPCPRGADCDRFEPLDASSARVGYQIFTVETLPIEPGYYRFFATSDKIYACADVASCKTGRCSCAGVGYEAAFRDPARTHGSGLCATNSEGPLCALCAVGHYPRPSSLGQGGGCAKCGPKSALPIFFAGVFTALVVVLALASAAAVACAGVAKTRRRIISAASFARSRWFLVAAVQVWYAVSTVARFVAIEGVNYPEPLQTVLQYLAFLSLDLSFVMPSLQCFYHMTYFELFLAWTLFPLAFGAFLAVGVFAIAAGRVRGPPWPLEVWRQLTRTVTGRATRRTATSLFWLLLVLLHNYICSIIFTFYSCSETFAVSESERDQWLAYDYQMRCGSDAYTAFEGAAAALLILYVIAPASLEDPNHRGDDCVPTESGEAAEVLIVPASLALKLKLNRRAGRGDGALAFFTQHVRPAVWYYEILALEVRLVICGALVPVMNRGLRLSVLVIVFFAWTNVTKGMRPYINRGHQAMVNYLQIFVLSCISLALVLYSRLLTENAAKIFGYVVSIISVAITLRLYTSFKTEELTEILGLVRSRRAFDRAAFLRLHVGMNARVMDDAVFAAALAILDELGPATTKATRPGGAAPGWAYLTTQLLPLRVVWTRAVPTRTLLATHAPCLLADAALLVRTRARSASAAGVVISEKQFAKDVDSVLGPLAQEIRDDVVAATFKRFAAATEPGPTLDLVHFEPALRAILDALVCDHAKDEEEDDADGPEDAARGSSLDWPPHGGARASAPASLRVGKRRRSFPLARLTSLTKGGAKMKDGDMLEGGCGAAGEERVSRMHLLRLWLTGWPATRGRPCKETPAPVEAGARRHNFDRFFDLAVRAHAANFKCWMVMEEAAAAILAEPEWGERLRGLEDFSDGPDAVLQAPFRDLRLAAWVTGLGGQALREHFDVAVLPHALRSVALDAHPAFVAALQALLRAPEAGSDDDDDGDEESWASKCFLDKSGQATAVKSAARMSAKVDEYRCDGPPSPGSAASASWPRAARIADPLRATIVCDDAEAIVRAYEALRGDGAPAHPFRATRLKNKLALCTKPFNLHVNCVFDRGDGAALLTTEVQIVPREINTVMGPSHRFYTLSRAPNAGVLAE